MSELNTKVPHAQLTLEDFVVHRSRFTLGPIGLSVPFGAVTALVGPNGAGKTTLLRALMGQLQSTGTVCRGDDLIWDLADPDWRLRVGYVPDDPNELLEECTAREYWRFAAGLKLRAFPRAERASAGLAVLEYAESLRERLTLSIDDSTPIAEYSLGMKRKTQLIGVLAVQPDVVILDEPRNGLDPIGILQLEEIITEVGARAAAVIVATHDISWALRNATRIVGLRQGSMVFNDAASTLEGRGVAGIVELMK